MFNRKQQKLFGSKQERTSEMDQQLSNPFIRNSLKESVATNELGNKALKYTTTGSDFVDQFANATNYRKPRSFEEISRDMSVLWSQNPLLTVCFVFYLRMITRVVSFFNGEKTETTQRGQGLKHEGIFRMIWLHVNAPDTFWRNIGLYISVGSWKDIFTMLSYDLQWNGWEGRVLDWDKMGRLILAGLENPNISELVKKYLPTIRTTSKAKTLEAQADTLIGKWLCSILFPDDVKVAGYKRYRLLKSSGTAHTWQQLISKGEFLKIDFNSIHGKALSQIVSGKFLANQGLEEAYQKWIESKPVAKFTGYVYELFKSLGTSTRMSSAHLKKYQIDTMNAQFMQLVETARNGMEGSDKFVGVLDTSGSMTSLVPGTKVSAYSVGKSLCLFMSYLMEGPFAGCYFEFSNETIMKFWKGVGPVEQLCNDNSSIVAGTNFQSIADHFSTVRMKGVEESEFPTGIVCFSDGCFNRTNSEKTNFREFRSKLRQAGFSKEFVSNFKVILWDIPNNYYGDTQTAFEDFADTPNLYHVSGLDGSALAFLTGVKGQTSIPKTSDELFQAAMNQKVLNMITV